MELLLQSIIYKIQLRFSRHNAPTLSPAADLADPTSTGPDAFFLGGILAISFLEHAMAMILGGAQFLSDSNGGRPILFPKSAGSKEPRLLTRDLDCFCQVDGRRQYQTFNAATFHCTEMYRTSQGIMKQDISNIDRLIR